MTTKQNEAEKAAAEHLAAQKKGEELAQQAQQAQAARSRAAEEARRLEEEFAQAAAATEATKRERIRHVDAKVVEHANAEYDAWSQAAGAAATAFRETLLEQPFAAALVDRYVAIGMVHAWSQESESAQRSINPGFPTHGGAGPAPAITPEVVVAALADALQGEVTAKLAANRAKWSAHRQAYAAGQESDPTPPILRAS